MIIDRQKYTALEIASKVPVLSSMTKKVVLSFRNLRSASFAVVKVLWPC